MYVFTAIRGREVHGSINVTTAVLLVVAVVAIVIAAYPYLFPKPPPKPVTVTSEVTVTTTYSTTTTTIQAVTVIQPVTTTVTSISVITVTTTQTVLPPVSFAIMSAELYSRTKDLVIGLRNLGPTDTVITGIYVNGTKCSFVPVAISVGQAINLTASCELVKPIVGATLNGYIATITGAVYPFTAVVLSQQVVN
ncbi:MAG: hypothetical protein ACP5MH_11730, partial [Thermoproteus sp.]